MILALIGLVVVVGGVLYGVYKLGEKYGSAAQKAELDKIVATLKADLASLETSVKADAVKLEAKAKTWVLGEIVKIKTKL